MYPLGGLLLIGPAVLAVSLLSGTATATVTALIPSFGVPSAQVVGSPNTTELYRNVADGKDFSVGDDDRSYVRSLGGVTFGSCE
jgi:hypothetical protein